MKPAAVDFWMDLYDTLLRDGVDEAEAESVRQCIVAF